MSRRLLCLAVAAAACAACSDSPEECGPTASCAVGGLYVDSVWIGTPGAAHPVTGRAVVWGDSAIVHFAVGNAGPTASSPREVGLLALRRSWTDTVPALQPGQVYHDSLRLELPRFLGVTDLTAAEAWLAPDPADPFADDDRAASDSVHLARPVIDVDVGVIPVPRVRANEPFRISVTLRNTSAIAAARDIQLRHCLIDFDVGCERDYWTLFGTVPLTDLEPGASRSFEYTVAVPPEATYFDATHTYYLNICVTPDDADEPYGFFTFYSGEWSCHGAFFLEVWPDFEACPPAVLGSQPVTIPAPNCGFYPPADPPVLFPHALFVWALDAEAGVTYAVSGLPGPVNDRGEPVTDLDPAADRLRLARSGRYYFVVHSRTGPRTGAAIQLTEGIR